MNTKLETLLWEAPAILPMCEPEVDLLRQVLRGFIGTHAQRNALLRVIEAVKPEQRLTGKIERHLGLSISPVSKYDRGESLETAIEINEAHP
jgi:hypothetical protein